MCILVGELIVKDSGRGISLPGVCTYVSVGATVRSVGEETLAFITCHASRTLVASHGQAKPESEVDEIHFDREAVIWLGDKLFRADWITTIAREVTVQGSLYTPTMRPFALYLLSRRLICRSFSILWYSSIPRELRLLVSSAMELEFDVFCTQLFDCQSPMNMFADRGRMLNRAPEP